MAVDWTRGYSCTWRLMEVDQGTWTDSGRLYGVASAQVERDGSGDAPELESASVEIDSPVSEEFRERYLRLVMVAEQGDVAERVDVCTMLFSTASGSCDRGVRTHALSGRSVLMPASTTKTWIAYGPYVPKGADGAEEAASMLSACIAAPITVEGSFTLEDSYVFDRDESVLVSAWAVLRAGNYRISVNGRGEVTVGPIPSEPALVLDSTSAKLLMPGITHEIDMSAVPNRYTAVDGEQVVTIVNDDSSSPTSTVSRGFAIDVTDESPTRESGESLDAYAERRLSEESVITDTREWNREWWPGVLPGDIVRTTLANYGCSGDYRVVQQSITCGTGATVSEKVEGEVVTWPM